MCETSDGSATEAMSTMPRPAEGEAVDPIALEPVHEVTVNTLVDNVFDGLLPDGERVRQPAMGAGMIAAAHFEGGNTTIGMMAEHGFSALVTVRRSETARRRCSARAST